MVYDWDDKRDACHRMYVVERKSLDHVMKVFKENGFAPSKRAFQTQFKRWEFPSKQNPAHRNEALVARTRELWTKNTTQKDMITILQSEGFTISERELMRLRARHRLLLRGANASKSMSDQQAHPTSDGDQPDGTNHHHASPEYAVEEPSLVDHPAATKRMARLHELQKASDEKWESKKRRRRTRGWAGLPADPPGPPRFPSETTLESSKACLNLDNIAYMHVRNIFQTICHENGIVKKTLAGPEKWQAAKNQLIQSHARLAQVFQQTEQLQVDQMHLSLDVICMDVTKRARTVERQMTLAEAKNMLGIDPEEGRRIRQVLMDLLKANNFVNKHESGNWEQLKQQWMIQAGLSRLIPGPGTNDHEQSIRAVQVICRDIMKRWRDARVARANGALESFTGIRSAVESEEAIPEEGYPAAHGLEQERVDDALGKVDVVPAVSYDFQIDPELLMDAKQPHTLAVTNPFSSSRLGMGYGTGVNGANTYSGTDQL